MARGTERRGDYGTTIGVWDPQSMSWSVGRGESKHLASPREVSTGIFLCTADWVNIITTCEKQETIHISSVHTGP